MNKWRLTIPGEPVAKLTGTIKKFGKHLSIEPNVKTRRYEDIVRYRATEAWSAQPLGLVPLTMTATFFRSIPASWPKKKQQAALAGELRPLCKPDCSNYLKALEDGLQGVVYLDDKCIVDTHVQKRYAAEPRVEIELSWLAEQPTADDDGHAVPAYQLADTDRSNAQ